MLGAILQFARLRIRQIATDETEQVTKRSALVLAPHPDDETLGCAGVIARKVAAGTPITVVAVSDGRHSHRSAYLSADALATRRHDEFVEAMRRLGLTDTSRRWLGYEDGTLTQVEDELVEVIARLITETSPDEVYVTGVFEPHPDHAALGRAARRAVSRLSDPPRVMEYPVWIWSQLWSGPAAGPPHTRLGAARTAVAGLARRRAWVAVSCGQFVTTKLHALDAHATQRERPTDVPADEPWWVVPPSLLADAADEVELFLPWRPRPSPDE